MLQCAISHTDFFGCASSVVRWRGKSYLPQVGFCLSAIYRHRTRCKHPTDKRVAGNSEVCAMGCHEARHLHFLLSCNFSSSRILSLNQKSNTFAILLCLVEVLCQSHANIKRAALTVSVISLATIWCPEGKSSRCENGGSWQRKPCFGCRQWGQKQIDLAERKHFFQD